MKAVRNMKARSTRSNKAAVAPAPKNTKVDGVKVDPRNVMGTTKDKPAADTKKAAPAAKPTDSRKLNEELANDKVYVPSQLRKHHVAHGRAFLAVAWANGLTNERVTKDVKAAIKEHATATEGDLRSKWLSIPTDTRLEVCETLRKGYAKEFPAKKEAPKADKK
jgi:hypothetical protein